MLQAFHLAYEPHPLVGLLFQNVNLSVQRGDKIALVGANGCGKTKLLEILAGRLRPNSGHVVLSSGAHLAYLPQDFDYSFEGTLDAFLEHRAEDLGISTDDLHHGRRKLSHVFGITSDLLDRDYQLLSLGERMRAAMLLIQCQHPDVLLLDEPTNHLDLEAREWLEGYLKRSRRAILMVCHDRALMDAVADRVLVLGQKGLTEYTGNYSDMLLQREQAYARQVEAYENHKAEDRRLRNVAEKQLQHAADMIKRPTGRTYDPKAKPHYAALQAKIDRRAKAIFSRVQKGREDAPEKPYEKDSLKVSLPSSASRFDFCLTVRNLSKSFGDRELFSGVNLTVGKQDRLAVIGPNGCGKTTLLRILCGEESATSGEFQWAPDAQFAILSQSRSAVDLSLPLMEALEVNTASEEHRARTLLAQLGMRGDIVYKRVEVLSVGERTKVEMARLLMMQANVLVLDEPTNHLDVDSLTALEEALGNYPGAVIFTSHDRRFVERVAGEVLTL